MVRERTLVFSREEDARFLEQLAGGRHVVGDRVLRSQRPELLSRVVDAVAPLDAAVVIGCIHPSARKHMGAAHERRPLVTADEEDLRSSRTVTQHHDGCGRAGIRDEGINRHDRQY